MAKPARYWAVIPAAGGGSRMGLAQPKQYLPLRGRALIEWTLAPFLELGWIDAVVVVLSRGDTQFVALPIARHPKILLATGGAARADSVQTGLRVVAERCQLADREIFVLVHDAARPCVRAADVQRLKEEASDEHGGLLALPLADTVKRGERGRAVQTLDRTELWRAQTPQLFRLNDLIAALDSARLHGEAVTDEARAMERLGRQPRLVPGRESNIKVTYPEDLALADLLLQQQDEQP